MAKRGALITIALLLACAVGWSLWMVTSTAYRAEVEELRSKAGLLEEMYSSLKSGHSRLYDRLLRGYRGLTQALS
ncbi:MAG: hypothetical protein N3H31_06105 [Candidatus Nezhaarchaeota archaeon]|nr:hypothetical protein [Candidatus Nezhaarchaeota archaeon]